MMLESLIWAGAAVVLFAAGWWASARHHQRKIDQVLLQLKMTRETAQVHTDQARRQIGQLQAELAARPPAPPRPDVPAAEPPRRKVVAPERFQRDDDGFPHTTGIGDGFAPTELQN